MLSYTIEKLKGELIEKSNTLGGLAQSIEWKGVGNMI